MCNFFCVLRSGFYDFVKRFDKPNEDEIIAKLIMECQEKTKHTYGYHRVKLWLLYKTRLVINHKAALRIMNKYGLLSEVRRSRPLYTRQQQFKKYQNVLNRDFIATKPNQKWATDISYIKTKQGMLYLSMIKDLHDNFIGAYDMGTS